MDLFLNKNCDSNHDVFLTVLGQSVEWTQQFINSTISCPCGQSHLGILPSQYVHLCHHLLMTLLLKID